MNSGFISPQIWLIDTAELRSHPKSFLIDSVVLSIRLVI